MAYVELTFEQQAIMREEERKEREQIAEAAERSREHELKLAKLRYATQPRYKSIERVFVTLVKSFSLPVCIVVLGVLAARGVQTPKSLENFINI